MKTIIKLGLLLLTGITGGCEVHPPVTDTSITVIGDQSDPLKIKPEANEICSLLDLKHNIWQSISISITYISDKDVNTQKGVFLEKANRFTGNTQLRRAQVEHFKKELHTALSNSNNSGSLDHSIIYRTVANQLNSLSASTASNRYLLLYSDLMENDEISFYNPATLALLRTHPEAIRLQLEKDVALHDLSGIHIWLLYEPASFEANNTYMAVAKMYRQMLESKGATVHIANSLSQ